ncbi:MAG: hypothetical protein M0T84_10450 [Betaproteobacteria bacterium]|nr:hypothetical protein [Betaproteobacteria bacterium]
MPRHLFRARTIWLFAFCYTAAVSLIFQRAVLPLLPALNAGHGLLKNDAYFYHQSAVRVAENIRLHGWSAWAPWSRLTETTGNVGVLSALYALFSPHPALVIPVNAFLHATSAALLFMIGRELWPGRTGNLSGLLVAALFVFFPSALSWYSQPLKDTYAIAGILMIGYAHTLTLREVGERKDLLRAFVWMALGVFLITFVKPYYLKLLLVSIALVLLLLAAQGIWMKRWQPLRVWSFYMLAGVFMALVATAVKPYVPAAENGKVYAASTIGKKISTATNKSWEWKAVPWLPRSVDRNLELAARTRAGLISYNQKVGAGSLIDAGAAPQSAGQLLEYLPRALQVGLFAPFPDTWMRKAGVTWLLAVAETMCWYLLVPGIFLAFYRCRSPRLTVTALFAVFFIVVFSFVTPNIGSLYRYRYAYEFLLMSIAAGGWIEWFLGHRSRDGGLATSHFGYAREGDLVEPAPAKIGTGKP